MMQMQTAYKIGYLVILVRFGQCLTGCAEFGRGYENARLQSVALCADLSRNHQVSFFDALSSVSAIHARDSYLAIVCGLLGCACFCAGCFCWRDARVNPYINSYVIVR